MLFLSDGTATASKAYHDASLKNLAYGFARVLTCAEAAAELAATSTAAAGKHVDAGRSPGPPGK